MADLPLPKIFNQAALAGAAGLAVNATPETEQALAFARTWQLPLDLRNGRLYLERNSDVLTPAWIADETPAIAWPRLDVAAYIQIGSTNEEALERARGGARSGCLVYAESQTAGRGRKGRAWHSPPREGLYFTLLVAPAQPLTRWPLLAHVAAVGLARAVEEISELDAAAQPTAIELKWPNDVLLGGKKCAGILLETASSNAVVVAAAIGVGVNLGDGAVPVEVRDRATSLGANFGVRIGRRQLLVRFLYHFQVLYDTFERGAHAEILDAWKRRSSMWDDTAVRIEDGSGAREAVTCGLTELGALRVRTADGIEETLVAGDVSVVLQPPGPRYHFQG